MKVTRRLVAFVGALAVASMTACTPTADGPVEGTVVGKTPHAASNTTVYDRDGVKVQHTPSSWTIAVQDKELKLHSVPVSKETGKDCYNGSHFNGRICDSPGEANPQP
jgi:hypothetical protein